MANLGSGSLFKKFRKENFSPRLFLSFLLLHLKIDLPLNLIFDAETGTRLRLDASTATHKIFRGKFDPVLNKAVFKNFVVDKATVIDVGANIGMYSLLAAHLVGDGGRVFSFEPTRESFNSLLKNIKLNDLTNITPVMSAVSDSEGRVNFLNNKRSKEQNRLATAEVKEEKNEVEEVQAVRLDNFLKFNNIDGVDFLKIDVEGAELLVMRSLGEKISSVSTIYFECRKGGYSNFGYDEKKVFAYLRDNNFVIASPFLTNDGKLAWNTLTDTDDTTEHAGDLLALNKSHHSGGDK
jgi:FkbM family methyltransferase